MFLLWGGGIRWWHGLMSTPRITLWQSSQEVVGQCLATSTSDFSGIVRSPINYSKLIKTPQRLLFAYLAFKALARFYKRR